MKFSNNIILLSFRSSVTCSAHEEQNHGKEVPEMREYEVICIVTPDIDESNLKEVNEKVTGWIIDAGGSIQKTENWGKRKLAYPIRKTLEGQYIYINALIPPASTRELENNLQFLESVMRYMVIAVKK